MAVDQSRFQIGFSADFLKEDGQTAFPDIGLSVLEGKPGVSYRFWKSTVRRIHPINLLAWMSSFPSSPELPRTRFAGSSGCRRLAVAEWATTM